MALPGKCNLILGYMGWEFILFHLDLDIKGEENPRFVELAEFYKNLQLVSLPTILLHSNHSPTQVLSFLTHKSDYVTFLALNISMVPQCSMIYFKVYNMVS